MQIQHKQPQERINRQIRVRELFVIGPDGERLGVVPLERAWAMAEERGLDLVEISPKAVPPVAKILDYGKFLYEKRKAEAKSKQKAHISEIKAIQITVGTGLHDLELKAKKGSEWLKEGHRVKITLFLKGRMKYLDPKFHQERIERVLHFFTEPYKIVEGPKKGPKGVMIVLEKEKRSGGGDGGNNQEMPIKVKVPENPGNQEAPKVQETQGIQENTQENKESEGSEEVKNK